MDDWDSFRRDYIDGGGSVQSAASYLTYLRAVERASGNIRQRCDALGHEEFLDWVKRQSDAALGGTKYAGNARSALRRYAAFHFSMRRVTHNQVVGAAESSLHATLPDVAEAEIRQLLAEAQSLGARYYQITGKPLGVTGEVAELEAADKLGLSLCAARTAAYDALCPHDGRNVQIKGRAVDHADRYRGMCPAIRCAPGVDEVALVLLDRRTLRALEIWTAPMAAVVDRVAGLTSIKRRGSGTLAISQFRSIAVLSWQTL